MLTVVRIPALIVGQAPSRNSDPRDPLTGRSGQRLMDLFDLPPSIYRSCFERTNLLKEFPGKAGKGDLFDHVLALQTALQIKIELALFPRPFVLLLGEKVAAAFGEPRPIFRRFQIHNVRAYVVPHPSGVNLWWNNPKNVRRAKRFFKRLKQELPL